ncbi:DUF2784 domain-containing protein [Mycolicibacterium moriokaense]|nr:DUF2784 domain-containing protein [Mycolicibacterium moriokaense]
MHVAVVVALAAAHFAYIAYLTAGGFLAWRWPKTIGLHALAVAWAVAIVLNYVECPLTFLERGARAAAGMAPLPHDGFIAYYITGVFYPHGWGIEVRIALICVVTLSWLGWWRRRRAAPA